MPKVSFSIGLSSVSIQLIAPASGASDRFLLPDIYFWKGFHSTDCPSEWGLGCGYSPRWTDILFLVSIQLIAPASGAPTVPTIPKKITIVVSQFPFN